MKPLPQHAMILAAGLGKRMRPLTNTIPKPMVEVGGQTMIDRALDQLEAAGLKEVVVNMSYLADVLEAHLRKRSSPKLIFSREDSPLETGGGVKKALPLLGKPFFVMNGDVVCLDGGSPFLQRLANAWDDNLDILLLLHPVAKALGYDGTGDFNVDAQGNLFRPTNAKSYDYVFTGIQILHPRIFTQVTQDVFSLNMLYAAAMQSFPSRIKAIIHDGDWLHIGDPKGKEDADAFLAARAG